MKDSTLPKGKLHKQHQGVRYSTEIAACYFESLHGEYDKDDQWLRSSNMAARESALVRHCIARPTSFFLPNLKKPFILPEEKS